MANGEITLTRQEAIDVLAALDTALHELIDDERLTLVMQLEDAAGVLVDKLFPDEP